MTKETYKYPYNVRTEDEIKIFFSDQICEQVSFMLQFQLNYYLFTSIPSNAN